MLVRDLVPYWIIVWVILFLWNIIYLAWSLRKSSKQEIDANFGNYMIGLAATAFLLVFCPFLLPAYVIIYLVMFFFKSLVFVFKKLG